MLRSWRNTASRKIWEGERPNRFRSLDIDMAIDLLLALNAGLDVDFRLQGCAQAGVEQVPIIIGVQIFAAE